MVKRIVLPLVLLTVAGFFVASAVSSVHPTVGRNLNPCGVGQANPCAPHQVNPCAPRAGNSS